MRLTKKELQTYWAFQELCHLRTHQDYLIELEETGDHCSVFIKKDEIIITIDGSDSVPEWASNLNFALPIKGFHKSFYRIASKFTNRLHTILGSILREVPGDPLITIQGREDNGKLNTISFPLLSCVHPFAFRTS